MLICCWLLLGCKPFERASECRALADSVNPELTVLGDKIEVNSPHTSAEFRWASELYARAARRALSLKPKDAELSRLAKDLGENLLAVSRSCDRISASAANQQPIVDVTTQRELEGLSQHHRAMVSTIAHTCAETQR